MKNLFSTSLSKKNWFVLIASVVFLLCSLGFLYYEISKKTITVSLNGKEQTVDTRAETIGELLDELNITTRSEDYLFPEADKKITEGQEVIWEQAKQVTLTYDGDKKQIWTTAENVAAFLNEQKITVQNHDKLDVKKEDAIKEDMEISVHKAFPITVIDAGKKKQLWSTSTTVADFLSQQGITLTQLDDVEPNLTEVVNEKTLVKITRIEKVTDVVEQPIDYAVITKEDSTLSDGTQKVLQEGKEGLVSKQFEVTIKNGKEVSRKLINEKKLKAKQDKVVAVGTKNTSSSEVAAGGGKTITVRSTAYTASCKGCSGVTATGINLKANPNAKIIAVDPSVIPLGSRVYVEGYGHAIAADKGGAIKGHKIDVFFPSTSQAYQWGNKSVTVKIID